MILPLKSFYFVRHGETDWNHRNIIMGSIDIPLNKRGIEQARHAAIVLQSERFEIVISSPRQRALKTAEIIAEKTQKAIMTDTRIVEREWGEAEGKEIDPTKSLFNDADAPVGAEAFGVFKNRVVEAISSILLNYEYPLIVSHGGVFKVLVDSVGYPQFQATNGIPFLFKPPEQGNHPWMICNLS